MFLLVFLRLLLVFFLLLVVFRWFFVGFGVGYFNNLSFNNSHLGLTMLVMLRLSQNLRSRRSTFMQRIP